MLVYSLLQELSRRDGLRIAVSGRTEEQLLPLLQYLCKYILCQYILSNLYFGLNRFMLNPKYSAFLCDVTSMILGLVYAGYL